MSISPEISLNPSRLSRFGCDPLGEVIPHLQFIATFRSNDLIPEQKYKVRQEILHKLIHHLRDKEGLGYRRICHKLNDWGIKTERGNRWMPQSVFSVLKRRDERDQRIANQRNAPYPVEIGEMTLRYYPEG